MQFHDVRFPVEISLGAVGGPSRMTDIVELANGREIRNARQRQSRRSYRIATGVKKTAQLNDIISFYEARLGRLFGFRFKDWSDFSSANPGEQPDARDQRIGTGDDVNRDFQLIKTYYSGDYKVARKITKPILDTVRVMVDQRDYEMGKEFEVDALSGILSFKEPPEAGAPIFAGFEFDVPVRFDCESLEINLSHFDAGEIQNISLVEILE